jgi:hypothetical protein
VPLFSGAEYSATASSYTSSRSRIFARNSGTGFPITTSIGTNFPSLAQNVSYSFNIMSNDSPRTIKDYYALVTLQRHHIGNPPESDERIEVVVRIPEEVAKTLAGGRKPSVVIFEVGSRVRNVATETAGVPNDSSLVIAVVSTVDAVMPPSLPTESNFKDQDGAEGWILPKLD